jgi:hypothetical protein
MGELTQKLKETLKSAKDTVVGIGDKADYKDASSDPLTKDKSKKPTSPAKIKEYVPTATKRKAEMTKWQRTKEEITGQGQVDTNLEEEIEKARRSDITEGTAGSGKTGSEYEQGSAP